MKKFIGSGLIEYALPLALIGIVVGLGLYYIGSNGLLTSFFNNSTNATYNVTTKESVANKSSDNVSLLVNPAASSYGGSSAQPVKKCDGTKCNIDFGEFILTGIPEDFAGFVNANGNSGGIEELCNMLIQIADQLEEKGDTAGAKDYRDLANLGYFTSDIQKKMESSSSSCLYAGITATNMYNCVSNKLNIANFTVPSNLSTIIPSFRDANFDDLVRSGAFSIPIAMEKYKGGLYDPSVDSSKPSFQVVMTYDRIVNDSSYSESMKAVTTELYKALVALAEDSYCKYWSVRNYATTGSPTLTFKQRDYLTGEVVGSYSFTVDTSLIKEMVNPTSVVTGLDSTLICTTGKNDGDGVACSK